METLHLERGVAEIQTQILVNKQTRVALSKEVILEVHNVIFP